jgi:monosaccharide-transporting ATPase
VPVLELTGIHKQFPGVKALSMRRLRLYPGEVHTLMGQNGAGKSTLIKVLTGVYTPDSGSDHARRAADPPALHAGGPGAGHQHRVPGSEPVPEPVGGREHLHRPLSAPLRHGRLGAHARQAKRLLAQLKSTSTSAPLSALSAGDPADGGHLARAEHSARVLILDEPTSSLDEAEVQLLFRVLRRCASRAWRSCSSPTSSTRPMPSPTASR